MQNFWQNVDQIQKNFRAYNCLDELGTVNVIDVCERFSKPRVQGIPAPCPFGEVGFDPMHTVLMDGLEFAKPRNLKSVQTLDEVITWQQVFHSIGFTQTYTWAMQRRQETCCG